MGKRKTRSKQTIGALPKGLPRRGLQDGVGNKLFDTGRSQKRRKHQVHQSRGPPGSKQRQPSALALELQQRKLAVKSDYRMSRKSNKFLDERVGRSASVTENSLARLVRERSHQSKRNAKYQLGDEKNDEQVVSRRISQSEDSILLSDDELEAGQLDAADTSLHFGGGSFEQGEASIYGRSQNDLISAYSQRKRDLDEMIQRRKVLKAEAQASKSLQVETFNKIDDSYGELKASLAFRDKEKEIKDRLVRKTQGTLEVDDQDIMEWDKEMREYMYSAKARASDRTRTQAEIAQEEAERLQELEAKRLARMNGEFDADDDSINSLESCFREDNAKEKRPKKLPRVHPLKTGDCVEACYQAQEQYNSDDHAWFKGTVVKVTKDGHDYTYCVEYDDGDYEENVQSRYVRRSEAVKGVIDESDQEHVFDDEKRKRIQELARTQMPFTFQIPTTLEDLNEIITKYAKTGHDVCTLIDRIYKSNSVRADRSKMQAMHNFFDVLTRRLVAVGDAIARYGDGGEALGRFHQLDMIVRTMYSMAQDAPSMATAVWSRRLAFFQQAYETRLRNSANEDSVWPSLGVVLALKALPTIFPESDFRHRIMTPMKLFISQVLGYSPIASAADASHGLMLSSVLIDSSRESGRVLPECYYFLSTLLLMFAPANERSHDRVAKTRHADYFGQIVQTHNDDERLCIDIQQNSQQSASSALLIGAIESLIRIFGVTINAAALVQTELIEDTISALTAFLAADNLLRFPKHIRQKVGLLSSMLLQDDRPEGERKPIQRRKQSALKTTGIKTLSPRLQSVEKLSASKLSSTSAHSRLRKETKQEHKAITKELRSDTALIEMERLKHQRAANMKTKTQRQLAFTWLEGEQAAMNQQVRKGGALLQGGGMGAAKAKAASARLGVKKGEKF